MNIKSEVAKVSQKSVKVEQRLDTAEVSLRHTKEDLGELSEVLENLE